MNEERLLKKWYDIRLKEEEEKREDLEINGCRK